MIYYVSAAVFISAAAVFAVSFWLSVVWLKVNQETVVFDNLPVNLRGLKILHISDIHYSRKRKFNLDIWRQIENLDFDLAVITGDLVQDYFFELEPHLPRFKALANRSDVFFVDGNHDMKAYSQIKNALGEAGVRTLENSGFECDIAGFGKINLIGVRDYYHLQSNNFAGIDALFKKYSGKFNIVLSHQPQIFDKLGGKDGLETGLVLSGHTHGGQVRIPFLPVIFAPGQGFLPKYGDGWYSDGTNKMHVSKGIGRTRFPIRIFNRPEISIVELT